MSFYRGSTQDDIRTPQAAGGIENVSLLRTVCLPYFLLFEGQHDSRFFERSGSLEEHEQGYQQMQNSTGASNMR
jgi:hypothetical protein